MLLKSLVGTMKTPSNRKLLLTATIACAFGIGIPAVSAVLSIGNGQLTITLVDPPITLSGGNVDGTPCTLSGSTLSCSADMVIGANNTIVIDLSNPAQAPQSASASMTSPSACGMTSDTPSTTIAASSAGSLTIEVAVASTITPGTLCTASVSVTQA